MMGMMRGGGDFQMHLACRIAHKLLGLKEVDGATSNPMILAMLQLDASWVTDDETPWCSAMMNFCCWLADAWRSRSLAARSWLLAPNSIPLAEATVGDIIILSRGTGKQPDASVIQAPGHVGFYMGLSEDGSSVMVLGGNQGNTVSIAPFPKTRVLGVRRPW